MQCRSRSLQGGRLTPNILGSTLSGQLGSMEFSSVFVRSRVVCFRCFCAAFVLALVAACVTAPPVQEMSDARQAIAAAREAGARQLAGDSLGEAEELLGEAEKYLQAGGSANYWQARQAAVSAKEAAFEALLTSRTIKEANRSK